MAKSSASLVFLVFVLCIGFNHAQENKDQPENLCALVLCSEDTICRDGNCIPDPCKSKECAEEEICVLEDVVCVTAPCYQIASCEPKQPTDPCSLVRCRAGTTCVNGSCIPNSCENTECPDGLVCILGECQDRCAIVRCQVGTTCVNGSCIPNSCENTECPDGLVCILGECQDRCAIVRCQSGTTCVNGSCIPNSCENTECPDGLVCIQGKCQDRCAIVRCQAGTTCVNGSCIPKTCENMKCETGERCTMTPIACFVAPCPSEIPMCFPIDYNCIATTCLEGTSCVNGECVANTCEN